jgi:hypothetical protein
MADLDDDDGEMIAPDARRPVIGGFIYLAALLFAVMLVLLYTSGLIHF